MPNRKLTVRNNQRWEMDRVPLLEEGLFRKRILEEAGSGARVANFFGFLEESGDVRLFALLARDEESRLHLYSFKPSKSTLFFQSLTPELPQAHWFEREIAEQFAIKPEGHPWLKPIRKPVSGSVGFFQGTGEEIHEVAVGPVHAGIIEPGHFRFLCHGEEILNLEIQLGYQYRGIEQMMQEVSPERRILLAESIAGDTVIGHAIAYCNTIESLAACHISPRAEVLRAVALELERLANHTGDLSALGSDIGFLPTSAYFGRLRGEFLNLLMELTGNRYGRSFCRSGGVFFDMDSKMTDGFKHRLAKAKEEIQEVSNLLFTESSVLSRLENVGVITSEMVKQWGFVGPTARASGCAHDVRMDYPHGMYRFHQIPISLVNNGDVYSRAMIRWLESRRSIDFLLEVLERMPKGEILTPVGPLKDRHMALSMVEGWRGEIMHVAMTDSNSQITRYKIKDPSFNNWRALELAARGAQISDFPLCNKSFNLSYAGHDL
ncbi:MAG: NADH-quinone oxidoreductase subunit C [Candidatus Omnitrophica bacterium]|nr:NADH-quinone oxidoreductase subunit C [Candidatus Omnitrophota bacterium]